MKIKWDTYVIEFEQDGNYKKFNFMILKDGTIKKVTNCIFMKDISIGVEGSDDSKVIPNESQLNSCGRLYHRLCRAYSQNVENEISENLTLDNKYLESFT